jgi:thioredoxin-dependent peroxiredoxin
MARLTPGVPAPDIRLNAADGSTVALSDLRGQRVVVYFYPKDDTSGCTTQACEFRDHAADFDDSGTRVVGVSPDSIASHVKFRDKHGLSFTLLSDPDHEAADAYGVWVEKSMYGRKYMGIARSTFVIGPDGVLEHALYNVKPAGHAGSILELLAAA